MLKGDQVKTLSQLLYFCALFSAFHLPAPAQVASAELRGNVLDSSGAIVGNAKVVATNIQTNQARETVSDGSGNYLITLLPPGDYTITVEAPGFRKLIQSGLSLQINQQARVDLTLQLGQVSETVQVSAQAPLLESESSSESRRTRSVRPRTRPPTKIGIVVESGR